MTKVISLQYGANNVNWAIIFDKQGNYVMYYLILRSAGDLNGGRQYGWSKDTLSQKHSDRPEDIK